MVYRECLIFHWKTKKLLDILSFGVGRHNLLVSVLRHSAILLGDEKQRKRFWQWGKTNLKYHLLFCVSKFFWGIFLNVFSTVPSCPLIFQIWKLSQSVERATLNKSVWLVTNATTASKYIPKRTRTCINWNPTFQTQIYLVKVTLNVSIVKKDLLHKKQILKILWSEVWKGGFKWFVVCLFICYYPKHIGCLWMSRKTGRQN